MNTDILSMRNEFDLSFAVPIQIKSDEHLDVLIVRLDDHYLAIKASEISGLFRNKKVVPVPNDAENFLGIAGIQNDAVPIYSLAACLGFEEKSQEHGRWIVTSGHPNKVGWSFDEFREYKRLSNKEVSNPGEREQKVSHVSGVVSLESGVVQILSIPSLMKAFKKKE